MCATANALPRAVKVGSDLARDISRAAGGPKLCENAHARAAIDHADAGEMGVRP
jgi:hypothetical protein